MHTSYYEHSDKHLDRHIAVEIIRDKLKGTWNIEDIVDMVVKHHISEGGLPPDSPESVVKRRIQSALFHLRREGYVNRVSETGYWEEHNWLIYPTPLRVFGAGAYSVYLFYDPRDYILYGKSVGCWACNIGWTVRDVGERVKEQTKQWTVLPTIALVLKTDSPKDLEDKLHYMLKRVWRKDLKDKGAGREWFETDPDTVLLLYQNVQLCDENNYSIYELYR